MRPPQVSLDAAGTLHGRVTRRVPEEDGVLCEVALEEGELQVRSAYPGPAVDERVTLRVDGGVRFDAATTPSSPVPERARVAVPEH